MELMYCNKKVGNSSKCAALATHVVSMVTKGTEGKNVSYQNFRCDEHLQASTQGKKVIKESIEPIDQRAELLKVNTYLQGLIDKQFTSSFHRTNLIGKYLKPNGTLMCQDLKGKWKLCYYRQIKKI